MSLKLMERQMLDMQNKNLNSSCSPDQISELKNTIKMLESKTNDSDIAIKQLSDKCFKLEASIADLNTKIAKVANIVEMVNSNHNNSIAYTDRKCNEVLKSALTKIEELKPAPISVGTGS